MSPTYLDGILEWHRARAAADDRDVGALAEDARRRGDVVRPFDQAIRLNSGAITGGSLAGHQVAVIAEVKRRSPSKGDLDIDLDAGALAADYERGGAAALSVLTDQPHFAGSPADLLAARKATSLPVLRKDFTVADADLYDARIMGADAVLLIVAALTDDDLERFVAIAVSLQMSALVEVHDAEEARRALAAGATIVGVNQRDLRTFEVDMTRAERVASALPPDVLKVAESGIKTSGEVAHLGECGFNAVLVGETLIKAADRALALAEIRGGASVGGQGNYSEVRG